VQNRYPRSQLAAKARLLGGDERVLAAELRADLEALCGPVAEVVPLGLPTRRKPR
jgi:hypothetical protein